MIVMHGNVKKMAHSVSASCPYSRDLYGRELTRLLVIIPKVVISLLKVSRGIIPFEEHIVPVGTTSNNTFSNALKASKSYIHKNIRKIKGNQQRIKS